MCVVYIKVQGAPVQQPQAQVASAADIQAQWAEYYRSMGYPYYGQQPGGQPGGQPGQPPSGGGEGKVSIPWFVNFFNLT